MIVDGVEVFLYCDSSSCSKKPVSFFFCLCIYSVYVRLLIQGHTYVWGYTCVQMCLEAQNGPQVSSSVALRFLYWAQSPSNSVNSASQIVPRKLCLHLRSNGISGGLLRPCDIYMGAGDLDFGPQVCTPSPEPSPSLKSALRCLPQSMCERHAFLQRDNFQTPQILGHQWVKVCLYLTTPSCTVSSLSLFNCVSMTSQHYKLASFKTEGYPMSYTGQDLLGKGPGVVWEHYKQ